MQEFINLYTIFVVDVSAQATVSKTNQLTVSVECYKVLQQNTETPQNPRQIKPFL